MTFMIEHPCVAPIAMLVVQIIANVTNVILSIS